MIGPRILLDKDLKNKEGFYENEINSLIDRINTPSEVILYIHEWIIKNTKKGDKVLDVGCGAGILCFHLKAAGRNPEGVDLTQRSVDFCTDKVPGVKFTKGEAEKLPYPDKSFDVVASNQLIEHLKEPKLAIKEMIRVCKPNGKIILTTPIKNAFGGREVGHLHFFDYYDMMDLFEPYGEYYKIYWLNKFERKINNKNVFGVVFNVRQR